MLHTPYNIHAIHHASLVVADYSKSLRFFTDILGMELDPNRPDLGFPGAWLFIGSDKIQQLHLMEFPEQAALIGNTKSEEHPGHGPHLALAVENLSIIQNKLDQENIDYSPSRSGRTALFCNDFDGNTIEIIEMKSKQ